MCVWYDDYGSGMSVMDCEINCLIERLIPSKDVNNSFHKIVLKHMISTAIKIFFCSKIKIFC